MDKDVSLVNTEVAKAMPVYLFTLSEVEFLKAEVELRFNNDEAAAKLIMRLLLRMTSCLVRLQVTLISLQVIR